MKTFCFGLSCRGTGWTLLLPIVLLGLLATESASAAPTIRIASRVTASQGLPPTDALCRAAFGIPCYSPQEIRTAYGLTSLINAGYTGAGQTIILIEPYGSPTLAADLQQFDSDFGLPAPPSLKVLSPLGAVMSWAPWKPG